MYVASPKNGNSPPRKFVRESRSTSLTKIAIAAASGPTQRARPKIEPATHNWTTTSSAAMTAVNRNTISGSPSFVT